MGEIHHLEEHVNEEKKSYAAPACPVGWKNEAEGPKGRQPKSLSGKNAVKQGMFARRQSGTEMQRRISKVGGKAIAFGGDIIKLDVTRGLDSESKCVDEVFTYTWKDH